MADGILRAYINQDAINCWYDGGEMDKNIGQVEIYETDEEGNPVDEVEWESYTTVEEMEERVNYINSNNFTWKTLDK